MLNSNFDLRTFLMEAKNPTLSEGAKFKVGDMVKLSGGEPTEVLAVRKMTDSDLHAYSIKNSKGERAEYDETQLTAADVSEVLSEATVMEYIRERMDRMNDDVRSCMREYIQACNEIDPGHEDAHAQLMNALEDFYNKLKAHFEEDEAEMEEPLATTEPAPSRQLDASPMYEGEEEEDDDTSFGGEKDQLDEEVANEGFLDRLKKKPAQSSAAPAKVLSADEIQARIDKAETGTIVDILDDAVVQQTIDLRNATPEQIKMFVSVAREADAGGDTITGDNYMSYLKELPNYGSIKEGEPEDFEKATPGDPNYDSEKLALKQAFGEEVNEALDPETVDLLMGLAKTAVNMGTVPAALAVLYQFKDHPKIAKVVTAFEKHLDK